MPNFVSTILYFSLKVGPPPRMYKLQVPLKLDPSLPPNIALLEHVLASELSSV